MASPPRAGEESAALLHEGAEQGGHVHEGAEPGVERGGGGRWRLALGLSGLLALVGVVAVGLARTPPGAGGAGLRIAAVQSLAEAGEPGAVTPEVAQKRYDKRSKLAIEKDLSDSVKAIDLPSGAVPGEKVELQHAARQLFDHMADSAGFGGDLNEAERAAFRERFIAEMTGQSKEDGGAELSIEAYLSRAGYALESQKPVVTESIAKAINEAGLGFKAKMRDWMVHESKETFQRRLGRTPLPEEKAEELKKKQKQQRGAGKRDPPSVELPESFDATEKWPECAEVIGKIHNQGHCGSCWVFGALGPLDSRLCIATRGAMQHFDGDMAMLSRGFAASCATTEDGCMGGWEYYVYDYIEREAGIPSTACSPYFASGAGSEHFDDSGAAPPCPADCDPRFPRSLGESVFKPSGVGNYTLVSSPGAEELEFFKLAMYEGGPVAFGIYASRAFMGYTEGIFGLDCGFSANHAVQAIGWGEGYFQALNSWGDEWGDEGRFKVAPCVPSDYTIPGDIKPNLYYPLPIPRETRTTTSTTPPPAPDPSTQPCDLHDDGCWTSPNFPEDYNNSQECIISYKFGKIQVVEFNTEEGYDIMTVNGKRYSGTVGPQGVVPINEHIIWTSDSSITRKGWKICPFPDDDDTTTTIGDDGDDDDDDGGDDDDDDDGGDDDDDDGGEQVVSS